MSNTFVILSNAANAPTLRRLREIAPQHDCRIITPGQDALIRGRPNRTYINWGLSHQNIYNRYSFRRGTYDTIQLFNSPAWIYRCVDKLYTFQMLSNNDIQVPFTIKPTDLVDTTKEVPPIILYRRNFQYGGKDIVVGRNQTHENIRDYLQQSPHNFVSYYIKKKEEYRVHATPIAPFSFSKKLKLVSRPVENPLHGPDAHLIRNHANGYIFSRIGELPDPASPSLQRVCEVATKAVHVMGLDFGAVDVIIPSDGSEPVVLEINTAPGLDGSALNDYIGMFKTLGNN